MWVFSFSFTKEMLREEGVLLFQDDFSFQCIQRNEKSGHARLGREWVGVERDINSAECLGHYPLKRYRPVTRVFKSFSDMLMVGYGFSQHCLHALMYTIHTHALTCSHIHTHITYLL